MDISIALASFLPERHVLNTLSKPSRPGSQSTLEHASDSIHAGDSSFIQQYGIFCELLCLALLLTLTCIRRTRSLPTLYGQGHPNQVPQARVPQWSNSAFAAPTMHLLTRKSADALPMAAQVTAISSSKPPSSGASRSGEDNKPRKPEKNRKYRPKGRPREGEMEDDSGEENDQIPVSKSVAQEKLQALMTRRTSSQRQHHPPEHKPGDVHTSLLVAGVANYMTGDSAASHQLRITEPSLCDSSVKQYLGYLDITDDKRLFFWFIFTSRIMVVKS